MDDPSTDPLAHQIFRLGPISVVPAMVVGSLAYVAYVAYFPLRQYATVLAHLIFYGLPVLAAWHFALIVMYRPKPLYVGYALLNLALYVFFGIVCLFCVTGDGI